MGYSIFYGEQKEVGMIYTDDPVRDAEEWATRKCEEEGWDELGEELAWEAFTEKDRSVREHECGQTLNTR